MHRYNSYTDTLYLSPDPHQSQSLSHSFYLYFPLPPTYTLSTYTLLYERITYCMYVYRSCPWRITSTWGYECALGTRPRCVQYVVVLNEFQTVTLGYSRGQWKGCNRCCVRQILKKKCECYEYYRDSIVKDSFSRQS